MSKETGGPAFPYPECSVNSGSGEMTSFQNYGGMTLRDYFAAKAMQGVLTSPHSWRDMGYTPKEDLSIVEHYAAQAYEIADAMLAERAK